MKEWRLLFGATMPGQPFWSSDLLWRTKFKAPDPVFLCEFRDNKPILFVRAIEYERAKKEAENCTIELMDRFMDKTGSSSPTDGLIEFFKEQTPDKIVVPHDMPFVIAKKLLDSGFNVALQEQETWYPERIAKNLEEIQYISEVQKKIEKVMHEVMNILRKSKIAADGTLIYPRGKILTSERLRKFMEVEFMRDGCITVATIIACGDQAVYPHCFGSGPLRANLPIVIDVFPRSKENWYWADMTRTVFKGRPTKAAGKMYRTVLASQRLAMNMIRAGADGFVIQNAVAQFFEKRGYHTAEKDGVMQGFFHGVGHGLGLDLHEKPSINKRPQILPEGAVVTVEPGLYYLGIGGTRIEDLVVVEKNGIRNLTSFPKELEDMIIP